MVQARARFDSELTEKENALGEQTGRLDALGEQLAASRQACEEAEGRVSGLQSDVRGRAEELAAAQATVDDLQGKLQEVAAEKVRSHKCDPRRTFAGERARTGAHCARRAADAAADGERRAEGGGEGRRDIGAHRWRRLVGGVALEVRFQLSWLQLAAGEQRAARQAGEPHGAGLAGAGAPGRASRGLAGVRRSGGGRARLCEGCAVCAAWMARGGVWWRRRGRSRSVSSSERYFARKGRGSLRGQRTTPPFS